MPVIHIDILPVLVKIFILTISLNWFYFYLNSLINLEDNGVVLLGDSFCHSFIHSFIRSFVLSNIRSLTYIYCSQFIKDSCRPLIFLLN